MSTATQNIPLQTRAAVVGTFKEDARTVEVTWSAGAKVRRFDYQRGRLYDEELSLDPKHVRMDRLKSGRASVLDSHQQWGGVRAALGVVSQASLDGDTGTATLRFSKRAEAAEIMDDVRDGVITNVSVGYVVHRFEMVPPKNDNGVWTYRAVDWEPYEISFVLIPADVGAHARSADPFNGARSAPCEFFTPAESSAITQESNMLRSFIAPLGVKVGEGADDAAVRSAVIAHLGLSADATDDSIVAAAVRQAPAPVEAPVDAVAEARAAAVKAEQVRAASVIELCAKHGAASEFQARALKDGWTLERTGLEILNERAAKGAAAPINTSVDPKAPKAEKRAGSWDFLNPTK